MKVIGDPENWERTGLYRLAIRDRDCRHPVWTQAGSDAQSVGSAGPGLPPLAASAGEKKKLRERFQYGKLDEKHAKMTHEEANWRLILTQPSGYSNSFSSGNEGKATRDDLHRKDWDGSSRRAGPAAVPPHLSPLLEVGHSWTRKVSHR